MSQSKGVAHLVHDGEVLLCLDVVNKASWERDQDLTHLSPNQQNALAKTAHSPQETCWSAATIRSGKGSITCQHQER
eukprot:6464941-Amphidinium_carterae.2